MEHNLSKFPFLLVILALLIASSFIQYSNAHKYTNDESASFLALIDQIRAEINFIESNPTDENVVKHADLAIKLLDSKTVKELNERNERVGTELPASLRDLEDTLDSNSGEDLSVKIKGINDLLEEAEFVRVEKQQANNSTVKALAFALVVNSMLDHYYDAVPDKASDVSVSRSPQLVGTTSGGKYSVTASWSPPTITAGKTNTFFLEFSDANSGNKMSSVRYAFMFMPSSDPDVMIIHRANQKASDGNATQTFTFKETRVGSNILRVSEINGSDEYVDFDIDVLPPSKTESDNKDGVSGTISSMIDYQSAQYLTYRIQELFLELRQKSQIEPSAENDLAKSVEKLKLAVDSKAPSSEVEAIVHAEIHPKLMEIYNLKMIPEFPSGLVLTLVVPFAALLIIKRFGKYFCSDSHTQQYSEMKISKKEDNSHRRGCC